MENCNRLPIWMIILWLMHNVRLLDAGLLHWLLTRHIIHRFIQMWRWWTLLMMLLLMLLRWRRWWRLLLLFWLLMMRWMGHVSMIGWLMWHCAVRWIQSLNMRWMNIVNHCNEMDSLSLSLFGIYTGRSTEIGNWLSSLTYGWRCHIDSNTLDTLIASYANIDLEIFISHMSRLAERTLTRKDFDSISFLSSFLHSKTRFIQTGANTFSFDVVVMHTHTHMNWRKEWKSAFIWGPETFRSMLH